MKKLLIALGAIVGLYAIVRAMAEPFVINPGAPSTYHLDWGGPTLIGVLAVHCGPGIAAAAWMVTALVRRRRRTVSTTVTAADSPWDQRSHAR